jgi:hypothetical protein
MGKLYVGNVLRDTVGQLKIGNANVLEGYVGNVLVFPQPTTTTTTTTSTTTTTTTLSTTTSTTTTTTTAAPTTTTSTTTTTTTQAVVNFTIVSGSCTGGPGNGSITISAYTGGGGLYQITTTTYTSASSALGGTFADDVAPNTYTLVPNGTRFVAVRDKITPANVTAKSVTINCTTTTTTTTSTTTTTTTAVPSVNHFRSTTPQVNSTNACTQTTPTNVYTSVANSTMAVGVTFYTDSGLTTTANGASQWFKILWKGAVGFNDIYFVQVNSVGIVQDFGFCSSITTTTTTTTTTSTSTTTTTTTVAPIYSINVTSAENACNGVLGCDNFKVTFTGTATLCLCTGFTVSSISRACFDNEVGIDEAFWMSDGTNVRLFARTGTTFAATSAGSCTSCGGGPPPTS